MNRTTRALRATRKAAGRALRQQVPLHSQGEWEATHQRPDPIRLLQAQDDARLQHLVPIKNGRMLTSPFAFLRGSAAVMAADLAVTPLLLRAGKAFQAPDSVANLPAT